jgi:hypothetical protein
MKTVIPMLALAISAAVPTLTAADDEPGQDRSAQYKQLEQQINDYWHVDSTWVGTVNMDREQTLVHLMGAEVLTWQLQNNLKKRNDEEDYTIASSSGSRLHEEVLSAASDAIPVLRKHPTQRLVQLLITHLETYPHDWAQEGYEDLRGFCARQRTNVVRVVVSRYRLGVRDLR